MIGRVAGGILLMIGGALMLVAPHVSQFNVPFLPFAKQEGSWVVVIEDTEQRSKEVAIIYNASEYWKSIESRGLKRRWYDINSDEAAEYKTAIDKVSLPALVIQSRDGKQLYAGSLPMTVDGLDSTISRATGL
jgi:hypothetical protein